MTTPRLITSLTNDRIKAIRALDMRKVRRETGQFVAEGAAILETAREAGFRPETLVYLKGAAQSGVAAELVRWALESNAEVLEVSDSVLQKLAAKDNPQTMLAVFRQTWATPPDPANVSRESVWLVLEEIRDPGNLGTIIRTVEAVGASSVILVGTCCDPFARDAIRATMGSIFAVPIVRMSREAFLEWRAEWPGTVAGTHLDAHEDFRQAVYAGPTLLVMGSEGPGLSGDVAAACTLLVKIPMAGRLDSLNLAVATALVLYQIRGANLRLPAAALGRQDRDRT